MTEGTTEGPEDGAVRRLAASWLAWPLAGLTVALYAAIFPLFVLVNRASVSERWDADFTLSGVLAQGLFLAFPVVGALIASRRPRNPIGWICLADGLLWMLSNVFDVYTVYGLSVPGSLPFPLVAAGINNWLWIPAIGLIGTYMFLLFPDGSLPSRRWRPLAWLSGVVILFGSVSVALTPDRLFNSADLRNPFGIEGQQWIGIAGFSFLLMLPVCMLLSAVSLLLRFRHSEGEERQQVKWIAFAAGIIGVLYLIVMIVSFVSPAPSWFDAGSPLWMDILDYAVLLSFTGIPIAVGFAVLKYRLYDIDIIINRTLVYGSLTAMLVVLYFSAIVLLQRVFDVLTGAGEKSTLTVVASTLLIAALFNPLRRILQSFVDRRFYRRKYDAAKTLASFNSRLREETDLDSLRGDVLGVVRETMQPAHVSLWLRLDTVDAKEEVPG